MKRPEYDDEHLLFGTILALGNKLQKNGDGFYEEISMKQWFVMVMLEVFAENHPTLNELSEAIGSSHQNVKQLVLKLEQKGYVKLYTDAEDRRKTRVMMLDKCNEIREKYKEKQGEVMKDLFAGIDPAQLKSAVEVLFKLDENLGGMN